MHRGETRSGGAGLEKIFSEQSKLLALFFLLFNYPVMSMLWRHDYPLVAEEIAILLLLSAGFSCVFALLVSKTGLFVKNLVLCLLVTLSFLVQFNLLFIGIVSVLTISIVLATLLRTNFFSFLLIVLIALLFGARFDNMLSPSTKLTEPALTANDPSRGPVIHILLDGFIAPDGLPGPEESGDFRKEMITFFREFNFELNTRAYSHYYPTLDSMTRAFNFRNDDKNLFVSTKLLHEKLSFKENAWFRVLDNAGYPVHVYQSESMDFCNVPLSNAVRCNTFPMPYLKTVNRDLSSPIDRVAVLLRTLISQSVIASKILRDSGLLDTWGVSVYDERMLPKLEEDVLRQTGGAFFAHVLVPHSPLIYRDDCTVDYSGDPGLRWTSSSGLIGNSPDSRKKKYKRLIPQMQCSLTMLRGLFESLESNDIFDEATIIVHGDHGPSVYIYLPSVHNLQQSSQRDFLESYSTLYAVKWPNGEFKVVDKVKSLNELFAETAMRLTGKEAHELEIETVTEEEPFIYLTGQDPLLKLYVDIFEPPE